MPLAFLAVALARFAVHGAVAVRVGVARVRPLPELAPVAESVAVLVARRLVDVQRQVVPLLRAIRELVAVRIARARQAASAATATAMILVFLIEAPPRVGVNPVARARRQDHADRRRQPRRGPARGPRWRRRSPPPGCSTPSMVSSSGSAGRQAHRWLSAVSRTMRYSQARGSSGRSPGQLFECGSAPLARERGEALVRLGAQQGAGRPGHPCLRGVGRSQAGSKHRNLRGG